MSLDRDIQNIARLQASQYTRQADPCPCCGEYQPAGTPLKDIEGQDVCQYCYRELGGPQEEADARQDREQDSAIEPLYPNGNPETYYNFRAEERWGT